MAKAWNACSSCTARASPTSSVKRRGNVRRAKLYYLRDLSGKAARIEEKV